MNDHLPYRDAFNQFDQCREDSIRSYKEGTAINTPSRPTFICASSAGQANRIYVCQRSSTYITVIDSDTDEVVRTIATGVPGRDIALSGRALGSLNPKGKSLLVVNLDSESITEVHIGEEPYYLVASDAAWYVSCPASNHIFEINKSKQSVTRKLDSLDQPQHLAISPDAAHLYVANRDGLELVQINLKTGSIHNRISLAAPISSLLVSPDAQAVYVGQQSSNYLIAYRASDLLMLKQLIHPQMRNIIDMAFSANGQELYVSSFDNGSVSTIDVKQLLYKGSRETGEPGAAGVAVRADGKRLYLAQYARDQVMSYPIA